MKLRYGLAALTAAAIAIPTLASADTFVIKKHDRDHFRGARAEMREMRPVHSFHRDHNVVIIKRHHHHHWD